ncbi:MAG: hypothetical protein H6716_28570 [Polyangiaceae bacterium]|nr:hypothetical protein [Polyangiaceae bacterium]
MRWVLAGSLVLVACGGSRATGARAPGVSDQPVSAPVTEAPSDASGSVAEPIEPPPIETPAPAPTDPADLPPTHLTSTRQPLPEQVAGIRLGGPYREAAERCGGIEVNDRFPDLAMCSLTPISVPGARSYAGMEVNDERVLAISLYFEDNPLPLLRNKYGSPEYFLSGATPERVTSFRTETGRAVALWRLADGNITLLQQEDDFGVRYEASALRKSIEGANY